MTSRNSGAVTCGRWLQLLVLVFGVNGCGGDSSVVAPCLPAALVSSAPFSSIASPSVPGSVERIAVFVDASVSMAGFVAGSGHTRNPYVDLVLSLPEVLKDMSPNPVQFFRFGTKIKEINAEELRKAVRQSFYNDSDTHIGDALMRGRETESLTSTLVIVITDLFLSSHEVAQQDASSMRRPLAAALRDGGTVGILGIKSSFRGKIFDLPPNAKVAKIDHLGDRPFFLLMTGPSSALRTVYSKLSTQVLSAVGQGDHNLALFGYRPTLERVGLRVDSPPKGVRVGPYIVKSMVGGIQLRLPDQLLLPLNLELTWTADELLPQMADRPAIRKDGESLWVFDPGHLPSDGTCGFSERQGESNLVSVTSELGLSAKSEPAGKHSLLLFGNKSHLAKIVFPGVSYVVAAKLSVISRGRDARLPSWLRDWGFSPDDAADIVAKRPSFFPALNLESLGQVLSAVSAEVIQPQPLPIIPIAFQFD